MATRDLETSAAPSAKFLQGKLSRVTPTKYRQSAAQLTTANSSHYCPVYYPDQASRNIFAQSLDDSPATGTDDVNPPALTDTAVKQLQLDVESTALIRAAEELMVLTRTMKELWLFGDLNTIPPEEEPANSTESIAKRKMEEDESFVVEGLMEYLAKLSKTSDTKVTTKENGAGG